MEHKKITSNYDLQVDISRKLFLNYDQELLIRRFGLAADQTWIYLTYMNIPFRICRKTGRMEEAPAENIWTECRSFHTVMTIYDLLCYPKEKTAPGLSGSWCPVSRFAVVGGPDASLFSRKYTEPFQKNPEKLKSACRSLGGILKKSLAGADVTCQIPVTSFFPVLLQFWEGDEEFSPKLMLLWDENSMKFLHFETTYYLQSDLLERLIKQF